MNEKYTIVYSPEAVDDLRNIYAYISYTLLAPDVAKKQVNRIRNKIYSLEFMPEKYVQINWEPWSMRNTRKVPVDNYVVYYIVDNDTKYVTIIRIFYNRHDTSDK